MRFVRCSFSCVVFLLIVSLFFQCTMCVTSLVPGAVSPLFILADILLRAPALRRQTVAVTGEVSDQKTLQSCHTAGLCGGEEGMCLCECEYAWCIPASGTSDYDSLQERSNVYWKHCDDIIIGFVVVNIYLHHYELCQVITKCWRCRHMNIVPCGCLSNSQNV